MAAHSAIAQPVTNSSEASQPTSRWLDRLAPLSAVCVLIASCLLSSSRKDMWLDEGFTIELLSDRSLPHMMRALAHAADGGMPLYYLLAHGWSRIFGVSLLSLRLLSSLFICAGVLLLWNTLRKRYSLLAVALALTGTTLTSVLVLTQNVQARYYGLYFASAALVFALQDRLWQTKRPGWKLLAAAMIAHAALVMSHPFGILYSAAAVLALFFSDYRWGKLRWRVYLWLASSWLVLVPWIGPLERLHDVAVPHNWPPPLTFSDVVSLYSFSSPCLALCILFVVGLSALGSPVAPTQAEGSDSRPLLACAMAFLVPPLIIALLSLGPSVYFVNRYFMPSLVGVATILCSLFDAQLRKVKCGVALKAALLAFYFMFLAWPIGSALRLEDRRLLFIDRSMPPNLPVLVTDPQVFLPLTYLSQQTSRRYYYPMDWQAAVHSTNRGVSVEYKLMRNAKESGYLTDRILDADQLRCSFDEFFVLENPEVEWFQDRIVRNPDYEAHFLGAAPHNLQVWSVKRVGNATCR